jgi:hypothetical protein
MTIGEKVLTPQERAGIVAYILAWPGHEDAEPGEITDHDIDQFFRYHFYADSLLAGIRAAIKAGT